MLDLGMFKESISGNDKIWLRETYGYAAIASGDPHTKNGVIIFPRKVNYHILGSNQFPEGISSKPERLERPLKYSYIEHAERNAIYNAARMGVSLEGATMYGPWIACVDCARAIINSGITTVVAHEAIMLKTPERWEESITIALAMLKESGIRMLLYKGKIGRVKALFNGEVWEP